MAKKSDTKATETTTNEAAKSGKKGKKKGAETPATPPGPPVVTPSDADAPIVNKKKEEVDLTRNDKAAEQFDSAVLRVDSIIVIPGLNARNLGKPIDKEDKKFLAFAASMHDEGQHEPSVVQMNTKGEPVLLAGFRRQAANEVNGVVETRYMIKPGVFDMVSARASNLIENVDREQLTPVELVYGMYALKLESAEGGPLDKRQNPKVLSNDEIGRRLRLNKSTVGNYIGIAMKLIPEAQKVFRGEKKGFVLPVETAIEWSSLDSTDQEKRLEELLMGKKEEPEAAEGGEGAGEGEGAAGEDDDKKPVGMVKREKIVELLKSFDRVKRGLKKIADAGEKMKPEAIDEAIGYHEIKIGTKWERVDMEVITYVTTALKHVLDRKKEKIRYVEPVEAAGEEEEESE